MKKLFTISFLLFLLISKSNAQTQFPFYGFELSNYEIGDTLEYNTYQYNQLEQNEDCSSSDLYCITNKEMLSGNDSTSYTIRHISNASCCEQGEINSTTNYKVVINNDTVYNNSNNILYDHLYTFDTSGQHFDTAYVRLDTIQNLKRLRLIYADRSNFSQGYEAIQNIGIIETHYSTEDEGELNTSTILGYAHLTNYGIYGIYGKLIDGLKEPYALTSNVSIRYNNNRNSFLLLSSSQNLDNPVLSIYDLLGRNVKTQQVSIGSNLIDMQALPKGMYLYKVTSNGNMLGQGKLMNM